MVHTTHNRQLKRLAGKIDGEPCAPQMINTRNYMLERFAANIANNFKRHSNDCRLKLNISVNVNKTQHVILRDYCISATKCLACTSKMILPSRLAVLTFRTGLKIVRVHIYANAYSAFILSRRNEFP